MRKNGLNEEEENVMVDVLSCYENYRKISNDKYSHPDDLREFIDAIHKIQSLLMSRIVRRLYPNGWTTINKTKGEK